MRTYVLSVDHPAIRQKQVCILCNVLFKEGDEVKLVNLTPADDTEEAHALAGRPYMSVGELAHAACNK